MPRTPITLSDYQKSEVETLAALLNQDQIADYFGICRNTFRAICERDPEVDERYKRGKAKAIAHVANGLLQKARSGCTTSSIFYLKTQAGWRETAAIEHSGSTAVEHKGSASDALKKFLDDIAQKSERIGVGARGAIGSCDLIDVGGEGHTLVGGSRDRRGEESFRTAMNPTGGQTD